MRTTLELPDTLVHEAMALTKISTKTELIVCEGYIPKNSLTRRSLWGVKKKHH